MRSWCAWATHRVVSFYVNLGFLPFKNQIYLKFKKVFLFLFHRLFYRSCRNKISGLVLFQLRSGFIRQILHRHRFIVLWKKLRKKKNYFYFFSPPWALAINYYLFKVFSRSNFFFSNSFSNLEEKSWFSYLGKVIKIEG